MDLLQEKLTNIREDGIDVNDVDVVCSPDALIYVMLFYYFPDNFEIEAVMLKNTVYLGFKQDNMRAPPSDEPDATVPVSIHRSVTIEGLKTIFNVRCNGIDSNDVNSIEDLYTTSIFEHKRLVDSTNTSLRRRMHLKWLIESDLGGVIDMIHEEKYYLNQKVGEESYSIQVLQKEANDNGRSLSDCYTYLGHFLRQVKEDMREVVDPRKVFIYKFNEIELGKKVQKVKGTINYVSIAFEESTRDILQPQYINYVNNFDNN